MHQGPNTNPNGNMNVEVRDYGANGQNKPVPYPVVLPQYPCEGTCPNCNVFAQTSVVRKWKLSCWILFIILFILLWPGWIAICCICSNEGNKTSFHSCPRCGVLIG